MMSHVKERLGSPRVLVRYLYNPKMYGDSAQGGPSSFYAFVNSLKDTPRENVVTVSRIVGRCFWAMPLALATSVVFRSKDREIRNLLSMVQLSISNNAILIERFELLRST
jgi:hypothetical protein